MMDKQCKYVDKYKLYLSYNSLVETYNIKDVTKIICILQDFQIAGTSLELQLLLIYGDIYNTTGERLVAK
jgi:hypothetical protein